MVKELSVADWCAVIGTSIVLLGGIWKSFNFLYKKLNMKPATIRANFFKSSKSWTLRIYNSSNSDIDAKNIIVRFQKTEKFYTSWDCKKDVIPLLKKQGHYDIPFILYYGAPDTLHIKLIWKQGIMKFSTTDIIQLK